MKSVSQTKRMNKICITLYNRIVAFKKQFGYPPVLREICVLMDINSTSAARDYLRVLESWHWITMTDGKCRTMRLIRPTEVEVPDEIHDAAITKTNRLTLRRLMAEVNKP